MDMRINTTAGEVIENAAHNVAAAEVMHAEWEATLTRVIRMGDREHDVAAVARVLSESRRHVTLRSMAANHAAEFLRLQGDGMNTRAILSALESACQNDALASSALASVERLAELIPAGSR